jgi:uncharacterized protein
MRGTLLKIDVTSILNEPGASLPFDLSAEVRSPDEDLTLVGPVIARGVATSLGKEVYVQGHITGATELICSRCLKTFTKPFDADCECYFAEETSEAREDKDDAVETFPLEGTVCVLDDMIGHEIILSLPMKPLCAKDCKGLCPECGSNLNEGECDCAKEEQVISPFGRKLIEAMEERSKKNGRPKET